MRKRKFKSRQKWWTRERVILGLQRFREDFGYCPTCQDDYQKKKSFTGKIIAGRSSNLGWDHKYPSAIAVLNYFPTMRDAWNAAGFETDRGFQEWQPIEDWFILESVGILPQQEIGDAIGRTGAAVERRLYDLGKINAKNRWGITINRAETLMNLSSSFIRRYVKHGIIPVFRGHKNIYLNPADLLLIEEFDWSGEINPKLEEMIRRALIQRIITVLKFGNFREQEIYKFEEKIIYKGIIKNPRKSSMLKNTPDLPIELAAGDWVVVTKKTKRALPGRVGQIKSLRYSPQKVNRHDGTKRACWTAFIEFPKLKQIDGKRVHYTLPVDVLEKCEEPERSKPPLKQTKEAIRGRKRQRDRQIRGQNRFEEIRNEIS
jgi:hypothetical protein